jgi:hypothetical protein
MVFGYKGNDYELGIAWNRLGMPGNEWKLLTDTISPI